MDYKSKVFAATVGKKGRKNQDNLMVDEFVSCVSSLDSFAVSLVTDCDKRRVYAVSDGIGGGNDGATASDIVVTAVGKTLPLHVSVFPPEQAVMAIADSANKAVVNHFYYTEIGGATLSGVLIDGKNATVFNAGDSPIFYLHNRILERVEHAHTLASLRNSSSTENKTARDENTVTKYMGNRDISGSEQLSIKNLSLTPGDIIMICSDGVEKGLNAKEIKKLLQKKDCNIAENIVKKASVNAEKKGHADDTTAIVIKIGL